MSEREFWTKRLKDAEQELDAATRLSDVNAAAKRLMLAKTQLKRLDAPAAGWQSAKPFPGNQPVR